LNGCYRLLNGFTDIARIDTATRRVEDRVWIRTAVHKRELQ